MNPKRRPGKYLAWTPHEVATAARLFAEFKAKAGPLASKAQVWDAISKAIGRPRTAIASRWSTYGASFEKPARTLRGNAKTDAVSRVPPETLAQRDARAAAYDRRDLTQTFFGDPPIGFSALDRRARP